MRCKQGDDGGPAPGINPGGEALANRAPVAATLLAHCDGMSQRLRTQTVSQAGGPSVPILMRRISVPLGCIVVLLTAPALAFEREGEALSRPAVSTQSNEASTPSPSPRPLAMEEVCATLQAVAAMHELPLPFFVRLIWQESRFRADAVSHAGARGIAQFMPATAFERGLEDPHDPIAALRKSADYLRELRARFGNLGLAAAAYNSGPERVQAWLEGQRSLPGETRHYVWIVTGVAADAWKEPGKVVLQTNRLPGGIPCPVLLTAAGQPPSLRRVRVASTAMLHLVRPLPAGWSVLIAGSFSHERALQQSERLQQRFAAVLDGRTPVVVSHRVAGRGRTPMIQVRIQDIDRTSAEKLCAQLRSGGTGCVVMRASS
jgi:hypothetical protein